MKQKERHVSRIALGLWCVAGMTAGASADQPVDPISGPVEITHKRPDWIKEGIVIAGSWQTLTYRKIRTSAKWAQSGYGLTDEEADPAQRASAAKRLWGILETLKRTRDEDLPRMAKIEARLAELEPRASRKSKAGIRLIRHAIADSRRVDQQAVPDNDVLDKALAGMRDVKEK